MNRTFHLLVWFPLQQNTWKSFTNLKVLTFLMPFPLGCTEICVFFHEPLKLSPRSAVCCQIQTFPVLIVADLIAGSDTMLNFWNSTFNFFIKVTLVYNIM